MTGEPATEAPVNGGRNYNGPKVAKFLVGSVNWSSPCKRLQPAASTSALPATVEEVTVNCDEVGLAIHRSQGLALAGRKPNSLDTFGVLHPKGLGIVRPGSPSSRSFLPVSDFFAKALL
ncbi:hypothetical protein L6164_037807 [Bauhinia variegata]|uniref:Uncharacterized protein n=1 Tax=Bauhinia variegata TaxID=167791 RepID=A0ACB9KL28_BAUVA|nr:hypothetical protein L6164_037807 [Bauhinia variegata]